MAPEISIILLPFTAFSKPLKKLSLVTSMSLWASPEYFAYGKSLAASP